MLELPIALAAMAAYRQFIVYQSRPHPIRIGKTDKFPCDFRTGDVINAHDPAHWTDANTAMQSAARLGPNYGVGFAFSLNDPFWFVDIDNCLQPDGTWSPVAMNLCKILNGCAVEVSMSGKGLHIFGSGIPPLHGCKNIPMGLEFYHNERFVALTGLNAIGDIAFDATAVLPVLTQLYFPPSEAKSSDQAWTSEPDPEWNGPTDDDELIRRALRSQSTSSAFGNKASFADLWNANFDVLSKCYPDPLRGYDASSADAALAQHLAFWTGNNCERIDQLMRKSALMRDKWDRSSDPYLERTIIGSVGRQFEVLKDKSIEPIPKAVVDAKPTPVLGSTYVNANEQMQLFSQCVYLQESHKVLVNGGRILKPEQFKVMFGGYSFTMDTANEKITRDAWEAFTQNQAYRCPRVDSTCFLPKSKPGEIIERDGRTYVNTYYPIDVPRKVGDPAPFLNHLIKVLPDERDRTILLSYMAACVQHAGDKFQWAPLLQGVEGNGKTLFTRCVAMAIGERYTHFPPAHEISEKFNAWLFDKLLIGVEDVFVSHHKQEVFEILKPMITSDRLAKRAMQSDQVMNTVCSNFMFNSNHKDGLRKTKNDRRVCPLFSAQQVEEDLARDGMTGDYFPNLYEWLRNDGYAIVSEFLHTYPIPDEYNPAKDCQRAPITTSTAEAIASGYGSVEQEVLEAIEQGVPGFSGGWISTIQLGRLLDMTGASRVMSHSRRKAMLVAMGYVPHPALPNGRVHNMVLPDGGKPCLYVRKDSELCGISTGVMAAKAYEIANNHTRIPFPIHQ